MNEKSTSAAHWSFWLIAALFLLWNSLGVSAYFAEMYPASLQDEAYRAMVESRPAWATSAFAIAVWGGVLGCLLLLLRKSAAFYVFVASLIGVIVQMAWNLGIAESTMSYGPAQIAMTVMIPAISVFLVWYSKFASGKGWTS